MTTTPTTAPWPAALPEARFDLGDHDPTDTVRPIVTDFDLHARRVRAALAERKAS